MSETILKEVILPVAFNKKGSTFVDCEFDKKYEAQDNFQSSVFFLTATVKKEDANIKLPLVVKFEPVDENIRKELNTNVQFFNEIFMYGDLLPVINKNYICENTFPTFYYGVATIVDPDKDVIIIEDLRPKGFKLTTEKVFLDIQHLQLAMEKLGRFHALSYVAKKDNPTKFYEMVAKLKETSWDEMRPGWGDTTIRKCFHRAMDPLITAGKHEKVLRRLLSRLDRPGGVVGFMKELVAPEEPTAVLCHGDFCRNNMLFKYSSEPEVPVDVRFFDVATARYASPAVDIAFFLLMNSTSAARDAHWDFLLSRYHSSLTSAVAETSRDVMVPSLATLQQELRLKAIYGFAHVSFFLPMMLWGEAMDMEAMQDLTLEEVGDFNAKLGGDEGTELLRNMVEELVLRGCLTLDHPFLKDYKE
ncbi:uncharacterized protein LOC129002741 [Macrosteles quadrilineatus]|uniref:uncharacterized protein LOC129002741 n=1 Tax=Macrosteles quadrilineatus TaxID=74068 RepID=UPI0023E0B9F8|nr:uncharacterized protein LOC129002741 [Macrosteles quadrilineatus]